MGHFKPDLLLKLFWFDPPFKIFLDFVALVPNFSDWGHWTEVTGLRTLQSKNQLFSKFWSSPFKIFLDFVALVPNFRNLTTNSLSKFSKRLRPQKLVAYYAAKNFAFLVLHIPVLS